MTDFRHGVKVFVVICYSRKQTPPISCLGSMPKFLFIRCSIHLNGTNGKYKIFLFWSFRDFCRLYQTHKPRFTAAVLIVSSRPGTHFSYATCTCSYSTEVYSREAYIVGDDLSTVNWQYHACWWLGDGRIRIIIKHGTDPFYFRLGICSNRRLSWCLRAWYHYDTLNNNVWFKKG